MTTRIDPPHSSAPQPEAAPSPTERPSAGWGRLALRLAVSAGLIAFLLGRIDLAKMLGEMSRLRWELWALALASHLGSQTTSALRWAGLARGLGFRVRRSQLLRWYFEGAFFSLCLPSSIGGDLFKCYRLGGAAVDEPRPRAVMLAGCTVLADRVAGLLALLSFSLTALAYQTLGLSAVQALAVLAGLVVSAGIGLRIAGWVFRAAPHWFARFPKIAGLAQKLRPFGDSPRLFDRALAWSVLVQFLGMCSLAWVGMAMGLTIPIPAYFVAGGMVAILTTLPVSINGVGLREGGLTVLLAPYGLSSEDGVALGLLWFLVIVCCGLVGGLVYLMRERSPMAQVAPAEPHTSAAPPSVAARRTKKPAARV